MDFNVMKLAVAKQFDKMSQHQLFRTSVEKDLMWETYLGSFPAGTNPMFKTRTEHDCNCCRSFIKAVGNCVAVIDGKLVSIWDVKVSEQGYQAVADAMSQLVKSHPIADAFYHIEAKAGTDKNFQQLIGTEIQTWPHFFVNIPKKFVVKDVDLGTELSKIRSAHDVFHRALAEITPDAVDTVLELIAQNSIYRGQEHKYLVESFQKLQREYDKLPDAQARGLYSWVKSLEVSGAIAGIRSSVIGTLLVDLSEGKDLEAAVKAFEVKVAPSNYKRPTALVTPAMIAKAQATVQELGLMSALERRYANLTDITVNNVIFADRSAKKSMAGNVFEELAAAVPEKVKNFDKVEEIPIEKFISDIVPRAESIEILVENRHQSNLVSLVAPVDPTAGRLFKWDNGFSWAYNGEVADSDLRQAVAARGGRVDGAFRFSHSWNHPGQRNASLMDLHVFLPAHDKHGKGEHRDYGNSERVGWNLRRHFRTGGVQDVDYTTAAPADYIPVENITFPDLGKMPEGVYTCKIHNWNFRNPTTGGFRAEIECGGELYQYEYNKPLAHKEWVPVAEVTLKNGQFSVKHLLPESAASKTVWGIPTETFHKVNALMLSPNHWDDQGVGTKHYFFMIDGCKNDGTARGFFNEFLRSDLDAHRKSFELVGSKMQTQESPNQLSGLGFSSTQRNHVLVRIKGSFSRVVKVTF